MMQPHSVETTLYRLNGDFVNKCNNKFVHTFAV